MRFNSGTEPEPDLAVVEGDLDLPPHPAPPANPVLVVEVSVTTLTSDRKKAGLYARSGIAECWVLDVRGRKLEVHGRPVPAAGVDFGYRYGEVFVLGAGDSLTPLAHGAGPVRVDDLLLPPHA